MKQRKEDEKKSGIYVIENTITKKVYVGKSINIYIRIKQHVTQLNTKHKSENRYLINAWHKYGRDNFIYRVLEYINNDNRKELDLILKEKELYWMKELNSLDKEFGYNLRYDSEGGMIASEETKLKISEANIKRYKNESERIKQSETMKQLHSNHPEIYEASKEKLAYANRKYRIAKCDKITGEIIKIYEIIKYIHIDNPEYYLQAIKGCCQGTKNSYLGFRWHYAEIDSDDLVLKGKFLK